MGFAFLEGQRIYYRDKNAHSLALCRSLLTRMSGYCGFFPLLHKLCALPTVYSAQLCWGQMHGTKPPPKKCTLMVLQTKAVRVYYSPHTADKTTNRMVSPSKIWWLGGKDSEKNLSVQKNTWWLYFRGIPPLKSKCLHIHDFNEERDRRQVRRALWKARNKGHGRLGSSICRMPSR